MQKTNHNKPTVSEPTNQRVILDSKLGKMFKVGRPNFLASSMKKEMIKDGKVIDGHIAKVGEFEGYKDGGFSLTRQMFDTMIKNFEGEANPIPIYRGHADLVPTSTGEEPKAAGWILGLKRQGDDLWATMQLTDGMAGEIKSGEFRFTSIYARMNETDRMTGTRIGPRLVSLAITNQPFIDGLQELSLSNFEGSQANKLSIYKHKEIIMSNKQVSLAELEGMSQEEMKALLEKLTLLMQESDPSIEAAEDIEIEVEEPVSENDKQIEAATVEVEVKKEEEQDDLIDLPIDDTDDQEGVNASDMVVPEETKEEVKSEEIEAATIDDASMQMLDELRMLVSEQMGEEMDLPALIKHLMSVVSPKEEIKIEGEEVSMSNISFALSAVRSDLEAQKAKNKVLSAKLDAYEDEKIETWATEQISLGFFHNAKKEDWKKLYKTNKELALSLLKDKEPEIVLSKITGPNSKDSERNMNEILSDHEKRMLKGAGIRK